MKSISLLLVVIHFFTGALNTAQSQLFGAFNIFDTGYSIEQFTRNLNLLLGPVRNPAYDDLELAAKAAVILDRDSNRTLFSKNPDEKLPMASITKLMTALVVLDNYSDTQTVISVPEAATKANGSRMYLYAGETLTIESLVTGLLVGSANDAAIALAVQAGGSIDQFVKMMNTKAMQLGLFNTRFTNPTGFDDPHHYSTARELANLARLALMNGQIAKIVATDHITIYDTTRKFKHELQNTNKLISRYQNVVGVKTGTTEEAGESLVVSATGNSGQQVIAVLLNSPDRFEEGKQALDWALKAYSWIEPA